jgi:uncharacterized protein YpuA (DUF1002 family)
MSDISSEKPLSISASSIDVSSGQASEDQLKKIVEKLSEDQLKLILEKLNNDSSTLTAEEARIVSENVTHADERSVRIISAIEYLAIANEVCIIRLPAADRSLTVPC